MKTIFLQLFFLFTILVPTVYKAQTSCGCAEPGPNLIPNGNFEAVGTATAPIAGVQYTFSPPCPPSGKKGYYAINNRATQCGFNPPWNTNNPYWAAVDHTFNDVATELGNLLPTVKTGADVVQPKGTFLIVDPKDVEGYVYRSSFPVCPNTDYQFSFWAKNLETKGAASSKDPKLGIKFNGNSVNSPVTIPRTTGKPADNFVGLGVWTKIEGCWNSGTATTIDFGIWNYGTDPNGNDLGLDDFEFRTCSPKISADLAASVIPCGVSCTSISVIVDPPSANFKYKWLPTGETTPTIKVCPSANTQYTAVVSGTLNCVVIDKQFTFDVSISDLKVTNNSSVACNGGATGALEVVVNGGASPFTYNWAPSGGTNALASNLKAGNYTVTVKDKNGCIKTATAIVTEPPPLVITTTQTNVSCFGGSDAIITTTVVGGTPVYTYSWSKAGAPATSSITGLSNGDYVFTVTDSKFCSKTSNITITQPPPLQVNIPSVPPVCGLIATLTANASGGAGPYTHTWVPSGGNSLIANNLGAGTYTINITDSKGCVKSTINTITSPQNILVSVTQNSLSCFGGADGNISLNPSGGTPNYTYVWPNGVNSATNTASNLPAGVYPVTVTDSKSCTTTQTITIKQPTTPFSVTVPSVPPVCGPNASLTANATGGDGPYTYTWLPTGGNGSVANGLTSGDYTVRVTDRNGCVKSANNTISSSSTMTITTTQNKITCFGDKTGTIDLTTIGGTPAYTYVWSNGVTSTTNSASNLSGGTYSITITDKELCILTKVVTIKEPPAPLTVSVPNIPIACASNSSLTANVTGGDGPYSYTWSPTGGNASVASGLSSGVYTVEVSDANGCVRTATNSVVTSPEMTITPTHIDVSCFGGNDGSANLNVIGGITPYSYSWSKGGSTSNSSAGLTSGTIAITVTDGNSCSQTNTIEIIEPTPINIITSTTNVKCFKGTDGSASANVSGGTPSYTLNWMPGAATGSVMPNVAAGIYSLNVTDSKGCAKTTTVQITEPTPIVPVMSSVNPKCFGGNGEVSVNASGGTAPYTYNWNTNPVQTNTTATGVPAGNYEVTVTDANGCSSTNTVTVAQPNPLPEVSANTDGATKCLPANIPFKDNSISSDPITEWLWTFGDGTTSKLKNPVHTFTNAGSFGVTLQVKTKNGCSNTNNSKPVNVIVNESPKASFIANPMKIKSLNDEIVFTNNSKGADKYNWNFGDGKTSTETNPKHTYKVINAYNVKLIATAANGCSDTATIKIEPLDAAVVWPNAFTPNSYGPSGGYYDPESLNNDIFRPWSYGIIEYKLQIFNRWGELIFETEDWKQGWDGYYRGELCQHDVYVFKGYVKLNTGKIVNKVGDVTLLR